MLKYLELRRLHFKNMRRIEILEDRVDELREYIDNQLYEFTIIQSMIEK